MSSARKKDAARFPSYEWAWPIGGRDLLLKAAILKDPEQAARAFQEWHTTSDFDDVMMAEQRLLLPIARRSLGPLLSKNVQARLAGVERMLWSHSMVVLRAAEPGLAALVAAGIEPMIFKGAARTAVDASALRGRFASDIDVLIRRSDFNKAFQVLTDMGWVVEGYGSRVDILRSIGVNLRIGKTGEIDLHKYPYHQPMKQDEHCEGLWQRAQSVTFLGQEMYVPSPTDQICLAIAHGGIDGHHTSDWMVDCALLIQSGDVDWPLLINLFEERRLAAHAAIVLSYLNDELGIEVPKESLDQLKQAGRKNLSDLWGALLQARPKREHSAFGTLGRGVSRAGRQLKRAFTLMRMERAFNNQGN